MSATCSLITGLIRSHMAGTTDHAKQHPAVSKILLVFHYFYYSFHISSDFKSLILEVDVLLESLLETSPYIFNCSGLGAPRGRRSMALIFADDMSDSDELILFNQGCHLKGGYTSK